MVTVTISSALVEPNVISPGQNPTLVIFSKKPETQSNQKLSTVKTYQVDADS